MQVLECTKALLVVLLAVCSLRTSQDALFGVPVLAFQSLWKSKPHLSQEVIWPGNQVLLSGWQVGWVSLGRERKLSCLLTIFLVPCTLKLHTQESNLEMKTWRL